MKIILVNIGVFQEYIFDCIKQLQLHKNYDITIITNRSFFDRYLIIALNSPNIELIDCDELDDLNYKNNSGMSRSFRNGFAFYASQRLFLVYSYMKKYNVSQCVHIENDNMIYENLDIIFPGSLSYATKVCGVFDSPHRVIPGILYIPSIESFYEILKNYRSQLNDMENLGMCANVIEKLPILPKIEGYTNSNYVVGLPYTANFSRFGTNHIFDGAAIGQFLGGIDPRNTTEKDTRGFVNETCVVKYNNFEFVWENDDTAPLIYKPYLKIVGNKYPIVNLHIHSKNLAGFSSSNKQCDKL